MHLTQETERLAFVHVTVTCAKVDKAIFNHDVYCDAGRKKQNNAEID